MLRRSRWGAIFRSHAVRQLDSLFSTAFGTRCSWHRNIFRVRSGIGPHLTCGQPTEATHVEGWWSSAGAGSHGGCLFGKPVSRLGIGAQSTSPCTDRHLLPSDSLLYCSPPVAPASSLYHLPPSPSASSLYLSPLPPASSILPRYR